MARSHPDPQAAMSARPTAAPPLSPHLQVWRWAVTMATSITQRATGIAQYAGSVLFVLWLLSAAVSDGFYNAVTAFMGSPLGTLVLVGYTWSVMFHMANGIKYLIWDSGALLQRERAKAASWAVYVLSVVLTAVIWAAALSFGG